MNALLDWIDRGPQRTAWLNDQMGRIDNALRYYAGPTGIPDRLNALAQLLQFTDAGDVVEAADASRELWNDPSIGNAARYAAAAGAMAIPVVSSRMMSQGVDVTGNALRSLGDDLKGFARSEDGAIRAYHGSPHDFDRFDMSKIGTGEGAQAYGHGLYFAESEGVARSYRDALTANRVVTPDGGAFDVETVGGWEAFRDEYLERIASSAPALPQSQDSFARNSYTGLLEDAYEAIGDNSGDIGADFGRMAEWLRGEGLERRLDRIRGIPAAKDVPTILRQQYTAAADLADRIGREGVQNVQGRMYEVRINANPDDFLDWDAPLSEQPKIAQKLGVDPNANTRRASEIRARVAEDMRMDGRTIPDEIDQRNLDLASQIELQSATGDASSYAPRSMQMVEELKSKGIPGIRYLDAGSRGAGDGSRNFVVFDDNLIEIVRKYGIAGAATMLGISQADLEAQIAEQGGT